MSLALFCCASEIIARSCCERKLNCILNSVNRIEQCACAPSCQATAITEPMTITQPGAYCLANDINGSIVVQADNVSIDGNNRMLSGDGTGSGLILEGQHATVYDFFVEGFQVGIEVRNSFNYLFGIRSGNNEIGVFFNDAPKNVMVDSFCYYNTKKAVNLLNSHDVALRNVNMFNTGDYDFLNATMRTHKTTRNTKANGNNDVHGLSLNNSQSVLFENSEIIGVKATEKGARAWGIYVDHLSHGHSSYNNVIAKVTGELAAYGAQMVPFLNVTKLTDKTHKPVSAMASASPSSAQSFAITSGSDGSSLITYASDGTMSEWSDTTPATANAITPNGQAIAIATDDGIKKVSIKDTNNPSIDVATIPLVEPAIATSITFESNLDAYRVPVATDINIVTYAIQPAGIPTVLNTTPAPAGFTVNSFDEIEFTNNAIKQTYRATAYHDTVSNLTTISIQWNYNELTLTPLINNLPISDAIVKWYPTSDANTLYLVVGGTATTSGGEVLYMFTISNIKTANKTATVTNPIHTKLFNFDVVTDIKWSTDGSVLSITTHDSSENILYLVLFSNNNIFAAPPLVSSGPPNPVDGDILAFVDDNQQLAIANKTETKLSTYSALSFAKKTLMQEGEINSVANTTGTPLATSLHANLAAFNSSNVSLNTAVPYVNVQHTSTQANANAFSNVHQ